MMEKGTEFACDVGPDGTISTPGIYAMMRSVFARFKGKRILISIRLYREKRSLKQNAFYWSVVIPKVRDFLNSDDEGNDYHDDEVHDLLKIEVGKLYRTILIEETRDDEGKLIQPEHRIRVPRSSKTLTTVEWESFMDRIRVWAAEHHVRIPYPNEPDEESW